VVGRQWPVPFLAAEPLIPEWLGFDGAFLVAYGEPWESFLGVWARDTAVVLPVPGSEQLYRWLREAYDLRVELLLPLLDETALSRIEAVKAAVHAGAATPDALDDVDRLLAAAADADLVHDALDALHEREATLIDYARGRAGAVRDVAEVLRLGIRARKGEIPPEDYARAFVAVVNRFIPIAVQLPVAVPPDF